MARTTPIAEEEIAATAEDEVKPYRLQWSNRRLDLTRQKLELTRLPHETSDPPADDWWEPKPQIEFLIDYWLEKYSWRAQEKSLNSIPQFRTSIPIPSSNSTQTETSAETSAETSLRLHFIHALSPHSNAVPLLLIPPFPLTNLSLTHLIPTLTDPKQPEQHQPFHLIIPSLPGLGFSDALPNNISMIAASAAMLDVLMTDRLGYARYLVTGAGAGTASPAGIDWRIVSRLAEGHAPSCVGAHLISPMLASPIMARDPWEWAKWRLALSFGMSGLGYTEEDIAALKRQGSHGSLASSATSGSLDAQAAPATGSTLKKKQKAASEDIAMNALAMREPNTLAYALCDSPTGLLAFVLKTLHLVAGPSAVAAPGGLTPDQILTMTNLAWLPGPEAVMRFWAYCSARQSDSDGTHETGKGSAAKSGGSGASKPKVAITVFLGSEEKPEVPATETEDAVAEPASTEQQPEATSAVDANALPWIPLPQSARPAAERYICPAWGNIRFDVLHSQRVSGRAGLVAFERPEVIVDGIRGLAKEILARDSGAFRAPTARPEETEQGTSPLERVVVVGDEGAPQVTVAKPEPAHTKPTAGDEPEQQGGTSLGGLTPVEEGRTLGSLKDTLAAPDPPAAARSNSSTLQVPSPLSDGGNGSLKDTLAAPNPAARSNSSTLQVPSPLSDGGGNESTPDTLVSSPPLSVKPPPP